MGDPEASLTTSRVAGGMIDRKRGQNDNAGGGGEGFGTPGHFDLY